MSKFISIVTFFLTIPSLYCQRSIDEHIQSGIEHHDKGEFRDAVREYNQALDIDSNSTLAYYEISLSYISLESYDTAIFYCNKIIEKNQEYLLPAYISKSACLEAQGKNKESSALLENAITLFGNSSSLNFNLALNYYNQENLPKAKETIINGLRVEPNHSSSNLLLAYLMTDENKNSQSILATHYFLLLEPTSSRSKGMYESLLSKMSGNVKHGKKETTIYLDETSLSKKDDFASAEMMISLLEASKNLKENKKKTEQELFTENTTSLFTVFGELKDKKKTGIWWDYYVPFFYDLSKSKHMETYCHYISQSGNDQSQKWIRENPKKMQAFGTWVNEQHTSKK